MRKHSGIGTNSWLRKETSTTSEMTLAMLALRSTQMKKHERREKQRLNDKNLSLSSSITLIQSRLIPLEMWRAAMMRSRLLKVSLLLTLMQASSLKMNRRREKYWEEKSHLLRNGTKERLKSMLTAASTATTISSGVATRRKP